MAQKATRRQRATQKSKAAKAKRAEPAVHKLTLSTQLPSVWQLLKQTFRFAWPHRELLIGVSLVYGFLNVILVAGLSGAIDLTSIRDQYASRFVGGLAAFSELLGGSNEATNGSRLVVFIIACLAVIWTLRQLYAGHKVHVKDAYYKSMYPLIPFVLVVLVIGLQLLPIIIASTLYQLVVVSGVAIGALQIGIFATIAFALALLSAYFILPSIFALFIVTLPDMQPLAALRLARTLVKNRRFTLLRKLLALPVVLVMLALIVLLPIVLIVPTVAQWALLIVEPILGTLTLTYIYILYRQLTDD